MHSHQHSCILINSHVLYPHQLSCTLLNSYVPKCTLMYGDVQYSHVPQQLSGTLHQLSCTLVNSPVPKCTHVYHHQHSSTLINSHETLTYSHIYNVLSSTLVINSLHQPRYVLLISYYHLTGRINLKVTFTQILVYQLYINFILIK